MDFLLSLSASLGLVAVMPNLNPLLFITRQGTYSIQLMMGLVFLLSMTIVISVFLQEYNYRIQQLKWVLMMIIIKWCLNILLIPKFGLVGSSMAYLVAVSFLLLVFIVKWKQLTKVSIPFKFFIKILLLSVIMLGAVWSINQWLIVDRLVLIPIVLAQCVLGILIILIGLYVFKIFSKNEWMALVGHRFERRS
ncbi:polysaccharide biosynthesis C-terminal domain-containing protein [Piscibacillus salipiscarius]|uniref:polysaccharide biosynthesis C-terminal domain-containing protein n=1 Tax=Piscibacillus salipiscarius TaxID=299480 RepID=UPI002437349F|nr:polysaccharide biosynthesis C-terminal domain-containing protein [Piscibacillus salipiscarius]